jgi:hypothetical protein
MARCGRGSQFETARRAGLPMSASLRIIHVEPLAPPKPAWGSPCNGCGVCCLAEPCPAGMVATASRQGPCRLLRWDSCDQRYRCGLVDEDAGGTWAKWRSAAARRWIGAGTGCDCSLEATPAP